MPIIEAKLDRDRLLQRLEPTLDDVRPDRRQRSARGEDESPDLLLEQSPG